MKMQQALFLSIAVAVSGSAFAGGTHLTAAERLKALDANADGQVSIAEYTAAGKTQADFDRIDADHDGIATSVELNADTALKTESSYEVESTMKTESSTYETNPPATESDNMDDGQ